MINKPWRYGDFLIWPDTTISSIELSDCNDTVEGMCYKNISITDCLKRCPKDNCGFGIYTEFKNGDSICTPISTILHPYLSPLYRLKNQSYYDKIDPNIVKMSIFVNTKMYPFPPNLSNTVFFGDIVSLENVENGMTLDTDDPIKNGSGIPCILRKNATSVLMIQPDTKFTNPVIHNQPILFGDKFILSVKGSSYIMIPDSKSGINTLIWEAALGIRSEIGVFTIASADPIKKDGDLVTYSDVITFKYQGIGGVVVNQDNTLYLSNSPLLVTPTNEHTLNMKFKFKSLMNAYYCDEGTCKSIDAEKIVPTKFPDKNWDNVPPSYVLASGTYKGKPVFKHNGCWGICSYIKPGPSSDKTIISLTGDYHIPNDSISTSPPSLLQKKTSNKNNNKNKTILVIVISIVITILIIIAWFLIHRNIKKSALS